MNIFDDIVLVNKSTMKKSINSLKKNWIIVFTGLVYSIINILIIIILSTFFTGILSILAGFLLAIVSASLISNYLYLLFNVINYDRLTIDDFKDGFKAFLWKVYEVFFIAWIASFLLTGLMNLAGTNAANLSRLVSILILIALNPLPETIYQKSYSSFESIIYAFDFMKENWLNWIIPNIIFHGLLYLTTKTILLDIFTTHLSFNFDFSLKGISLYLLGQILFSFIMIYRGHLFNLLSTSTRRKRMYMNNFHE